ncbi:MAG: rhodanese-like domain-containing protein [Fibrobacterota bacterium]
MRRISFPKGVLPADVSVYRGDSVEIIFEGDTASFVISIPAVDLKVKSSSGRAVAAFKARSTGVYTLFCSGRCTERDGDSRMNIVVMQYRGIPGSRYEEVDSDIFAQLMEKDSALVLDVRTANEVARGRIPGAVHIPLSQLDERYTEIDTHMSAPVLVYCRSGNRSTVASKILVDKGFTRVYNLKPGIVGWRQSERKLVQE